MAKKVNIDKDGYLELISKVYENLQEERELALDRYRRADDLMENIDQFALLGKNAVSFLNLASNSTNSMAAIAKEIKSIVYKEEIGAGVSIQITDDFKRMVSSALEEEEKKEDLSKEED